MGLLLLGLLVRLKIRVAFCGEVGGRGRKGVGVCVEDL